MMDTLLKYDALSTGEIISAKELGSKQYVDYTTVTAPVLVVVDLAIELQNGKIHAINVMQFLRSR